MKIDIVEKITVHERVITDLMADIDGSSKNTRILRTDLFFFFFFFKSVFACGLDHGEAPRPRSGPLTAKG